jgi:hypothetical protein
MRSPFFLSPSPPSFLHCLAAYLAAGFDRQASTGCMGHCIALSAEDELALSTGDKPNESNRGRCAPLALSIAWPHNRSGASADRTRHRIASSGQGDARASTELQYPRAILGRRHCYPSLTSTMLRYCCKRAVPAMLRPPARVEILRRALERVPASYVDYYYGYMRGLQ